MNINNVNNLQNQTAFEARIKMNKPNMKPLLQAAVGTVAGVTATASMAAGVESSAAFAGNDSVVSKQILDSTPENIVDITESVLYDAEPEGIPVQSSI